MDKCYEMKSVADIFSNATHFLNAFQQVFTTKEYKDDYLVASAFIPQIVLKAFSCEMYLKSYISFEGNQIPRVHNLFKLYEVLNKDTQDKLNVIIENNMRVLNKSYSSQDIKKDINEIANTFEEWRYFYEKSRSLNSVFLDIFFKSLKELKLIPPLKSKK